MTCGECKHYQPKINPATGRVLTSKNGQCGWRPDIIWPMAFCYRNQQPYISPSAVWKTKNAEDCKCFTPVDREIEPKQVAEPKLDQLPMVLP